MLEVVSDKVYKCFFVNLFVQCTNTIAIKMYEGLGYSVFRRLRPYYGLERRRGCSVFFVDKIFGIRYAKATYTRSKATVSQAKRERYQCQCSRGIVTQFVEVQEIKCRYGLYTQRRWFRIRNGCQQGKLLFIECRQCLFIRAKRSQIESDFLRSRREPIVSGL